MIRCISNDCTKLLCISHTYSKELFISYLKNHNEMFEELYNNKSFIFDEVFIESFLKEFSYNDNFKLIIEKEPKFIDFIFKYSIINNLQNISAYLYEQIYSDLELCSLKLIFLKDNFIKLPFVLLKKLMEIENLFSRKLTSNDLLKYISLNKNLKFKEYVYLLSHGLERQCLYTPNIKLIFNILKYHRDQDHISKISFIEYCITEHGMPIDICDNNLKTLFDYVEIYDFEYLISKGLDISKMYILDILKKHTHNIYTQKEIKKQLIINMNNLIRVNVPISMITGLCFDSGLNTIFSKKFNNKKMLLKVCIINILLEYGYFCVFSKEDINTINKINGVNKDILLFRSLLKDICKYIKPHGILMLSKLNNDCSNVILSYF